MTISEKAVLTDGRGVLLRPVAPSDLLSLRALYELIVQEGTSYPHDRSLNEDEFMDYWIREKVTIVAAPENEHEEKRPAIAGAFYLKPNWPGRAGHVANAGFIVAPSWRRCGLGRILGMTMLTCARQLGYRSVIFNLVFADNQPARSLWRELGFGELARLPGAVRTQDGRYRDALIMWRSLV